MKKYLASLILSTFLASTAFAAGVSGTVTKVDGENATVEVKEKAGWLKKGVKVKVKGGTAKVTAVDNGKYTVKCSKNADLKEGETVTINKGSDDMQGC